MSLKKNSLFLSSFLSLLPSFYPFSLIRRQSQTGLELTSWERLWIPDSLVPTSRMLGSQMSVGGPGLRGARDGTQHLGTAGKHAPM